MKRIRGTSKTFYEVGGEFVNQSKLQPRKLVVKEDNPRRKFFTDIPSNKLIRSNYLEITGILLGLDLKVQRSQISRITKKIIKSRNRRIRHSKLTYGRWYKYTTTPEETKQIT